MIIDRPNLEALVATAIIKDVAYPYTLKGVLTNNEGCQERVLNESFDLAALIVNKMYERWSG